MPKPIKLWKKGRGYLGPFEPLMGAWSASADSPRGPLKCSRVFEPAADGAFVTLHAVWEFGQGAYRELAIFGRGDDGVLSFWSYTSDGKRSTGRLVEAADLHPEAVAFEAQMPAGLARQAYWPEPDGTVVWIVEAKNKTGWNRFTEHRYRRA